jgi:hypothetical protein
MEFIPEPSFMSYIMVPMKNPNQKILILIVFLLFAGLIVQACASKPKILGSWNSGEPANMQFDFRSDGSVWLVSQSDSRQIWHYEFTGSDTLRLYDGQGRIEEYRYTIQDNTLTFYDLQNGEIVEKYTRMKS